MENEKSLKLSGIPKKASDGIGNSRTVSKAFIWKDAAGLITKELGKSVGSERIYVNLDIVPSGAYSTKYHSHSTQEEFFYILSGTGSLRLNNETYSVAPGDFLAKPSGKNIAHAFLNSGSEDLYILDIGTIDQEDTCYYPDERMYLHKSNGEVRPYSADATDSGWSSAPNQPHGHTKKENDTGF